MPLHRLDLTPNPNRLAESLGAGLESLASHKMDQLHRHQGIKRLKDFGLSDEEASYAQSLPPKEQFALVNQLSQSAGMTGGMYQPPQSPEQMLYNSPTANTQYSENAPLYNEPNGEFQRNALTNAMGGMAGLPSQQRPNISQPSQQPPQQKPRTPLEKLRHSFSKKEQELLRKEAIKQQIEDRKTQDKYQSQVDKETLPFYNEVLKEDKGAKEIDLVTGRMLNLIDKGKLPDPIYYKQLKDLEESLTPLKTISSAAGAGAGGGAALGGSIGGVVGNVPGAALGSAIGGLIGAIGGGLSGLYASRYPSEKRREILEKFPDTEEFEKLSANFIKGAKAIFGSRITDQDLRAFMQTVPQLSNTEAGKRAIIKNIQILNKASHTKANVMKEIIAANGGRRPANLQILVDELAAPQLDQLAQEFVG